MYIAPCSGHILLNLNLPFKVIVMWFEVFLVMSGVRIAVLFDRFMEIHSNPPILYYGFKLQLVPTMLSMW